MRDLIPSAEWCAVVDFCAYTPEDISGLLNVLHLDGSGQYIYISTASVYDRVHDFPVREDAPKLTGPQPELGQFADYAYSKWRAEEELRKLCESSGLPHTSIRPAFIYGKYNYAPRENYFFDLIVQDEPITIPDKNLALFSFVSAWDVARIILGCIGNSRAYNRAFNASGGELISYERLVEVFEDITGVQLNVQRKPIDEIVDRQIPLPFPLDEHLIYSGTLVQSIMSFEYTPFHEGMAETYRYYRIGRGLK
jgi:nucleoside-diphosphate-sugar epimerase